jgi:6-methylsalicylate decarboxylase
VATDLHQHVWGAAFIDALRGRTVAPRLAGWTLHLDGEAPYDVDPADHDLAARSALAATDGFDRVLTSLSSPLGIEWLAPPDSTPLLDAYHEDALALPAPFGAWAAACVAEIDAPGLARWLDRGFAGLQLPATALLDAAGYERCEPLLSLLEERGLPLFVHPGPAPDASGPAWWPALVPYVQQMHAAWFAFRAFGRARHPRLRVCFALLAGLAPLHGERLAVRGGGRGEVDRDAFIETSSYGPRAVDATIRALGIDTIVCGSDRPYAPPPGDLGLGEAAEHAIRVANPERLLIGEE